MRRDYAGGLFRSCPSEKRFFGVFKGGSTRDFSAFRVELANCAVLDSHLRNVALLHVGGGAGADGKNFLRRGICRGGFGLRGQARARTRAKAVPLAARGFAKSAAAGQSRLRQVS